MENSAEGRARKLLLRRLPVGTTAFFSPGCSRATPASAQASDVSGHSDAETATNTALGDRDTATGDVSEGISRSAQDFGGDSGGGGDVDAEVDSKERERVKGESFFVLPSEEGVDSDD